MFISSIFDVHQCDERALVLLLSGRVFGKHATKPFLSQN
jgi:hypothetical protein